MRLYLDDDSAAPLLARLLRQAGHDVQMPSAAGLAGEDDPIHPTHAIGENRTLLTGNYGDFLNLHNLVMKARDIIPEFLSFVATTTHIATSRPGASSWLQAIS